MTAMGSIAADPATPAGYDQDFFAWTQRTAELLRAGRFDVVDVEHLAEEIEAMGRSDRRQIESRLAVVLIHLLKWVHQPERRSRSWQKTLLTQRQRLEQVLRDSPSLRRQVVDLLPATYRGAVKAAALETGLPATSFPLACPYTPAQILDEDFLPG